MLTHYTNDINAIAAILNNGFAWVPNKRQLIYSLLESQDFKNREPQEYGMICFTESPPHLTNLHRNQFGSYGIIVTQKWAQQQSAQKVLYIDDNGPVHEALKHIYSLGYDDLKQCISHPQDAVQTEMASINKWVASSVVGSDFWSYLLQLYEYVEPIKNSYQQEWRIVNKFPLTGYKKTKREIIENVSPPKGWAQFANVLKPEPSDISGFVCPENEVETFISLLPTNFQNHRITTLKT